MDNERELLNVTGEVEDNTEDYVAAIKELKQNTVDRAKYDELRAENKKLINSLVNGQVASETVVKEKKDINQLRQEIFNTDAELSNLDFISKSLELREALIEDGQPDPFLPYGQQILPTDNDIACANKVAEVLQECVDYAEGDSAVFTNELQRRLVDVKIR